MDDPLLQQIKKNNNIYSNRKDTIKIKNELSLIVPPEYWSILSKYLHGMLSQNEYQQAMKKILSEDKAKWLHNELLRAIIFNAHFSQCPPPGITIQKRLRPIIQNEDIKEPSEQAKNHDFESYFFADCGHLLSIAKLHQRMKIVINDETMKIDTKSVELIFFLIKKIIMKLLKRACDMDIIENNRVFEKKEINVEHLIYILKKDCILSQFISPSLEIKYGESK